MKQKPSGVALFMYAVIAVSAAVSAVCFALYYGGAFVNGIFLWVGIVFFMIMYHLWLRLIFGAISRYFPINSHARWFRPLAFEKGLYRLLRVKRWKNTSLTYNPESFSLKDHSLEEIATTMSKAETDHWMNEGISLSSLLFSLLWGEFWIFLITALAAMVFDARFIIIQRYNRPRILKVAEKQRQKKNRNLSGGLPL